MGMAVGTTTEAKVEATMMEATTAEITMAEGAMVEGTRVELVAQVIHSTKEQPITLR